MKIMIVDIGSNTIKYDIFDPPCPKSIGHRSVAAGIIRYIQNGVMTEEGKRILWDILLSYQKDALENNIPLYAFATASLRRVAEPAKLIAEVKAQTGILIDLVSGEEESALSLMGMLSVTENAKKGVMMDMGGGSTELNRFNGGTSLFSISCPFGALSLKNEFVSGVFPTQKDTDAIMQYVRSVLHPHRANIETDILYMVGGSAKAIARLMRLHNKLPNGTMTFAPSDFSDLLCRYLKSNDEDYSLLKSLFPDRYPVMLPALAAYVSLLSCCGAKTVVVSHGGVREGYLQHILDNKEEA